MLIGSGAPIRLLCTLRLSGICMMPMGGCECHRGLSAFA
jgi:hypothetical protein